MWPGNGPADSVLRETVRTGIKKKFASDGARVAPFARPGAAKCGVWIPFVESVGLSPAFEFRGRVVHGFDRLCGARRMELRLICRGCADINHVVNNARRPIPPPRSAAGAERCNGKGLRPIHVPSPDLLEIVVLRCRACTTRAWPEAECIWYRSDCAVSRMSV